MNRPLRVVLFAPANEILGGQAVQAQRLVAEIGRVPGIDLRFQAINPLFPSYLRWMKKIPALRTALTMTLYLPRVAFHAMWADVFHVFSAGLYSFTLWTIPAVLLGRLFGTKIIVNYRDGQAEQHLRNFRSATRTLKLADAIVFPTAFLEQIFAEFKLSSQVIPNVIDPEEFIYRRRGKLRPLIMTNRILEPLYNIECILRAFEIVQQSYPDAKLTIAHIGPSEAHLREYAASLELRNYAFIGKVPPARIAHLYDGADIYVTTPNIDCMPGSLLECMASGIPIVATRTGGIPSIVTDEETALLVEVDDHVAAAGQIIRLLRDESLVRRLTEAARREVEKYRAAPIRDQWVNLYRQLVTQYGPRNLGASSSSTSAVATEQHSVDEDSRRL
jgi:glycosyltransferase involved in cell wall biosynthesis